MRGVTYLSHRGTIGTKAVRDDRPGAPVSFYRPFRECHGRLAIALLCHEHLQDFAFVINRSPEIVQLTVDANENLVEMPLPLRIRSQGARLFLVDKTGEFRSEPVPSGPDGLMAHVNAALMQQILDLPQGKRKSDVHHHRDPDDLGRKAKTLERSVVQPVTLRRK
jgi:hypothetical protein